ncbi:hypothetical protein BH18ACT4_BH18ACT4_08150 [soil metagenome]
MAADDIHLSLPPADSYAVVVADTAAVLAARVGCSPAEIEALRSRVAAEFVSAVAEALAGDSDATVGVHYRVELGAVTSDGHSALAVDVRPETASEPS